MIEIRFHVDARQELLQSVRYYEGKLSGLGLAFADEVEHATSLIRNNPGIGSRVWQNYQRVLVRRFPYALVYRVLDSTVTILAVAHLRRRPNYWARRF